MQAWLKSYSPVICKSDDDNDDNDGLTRDERLTKAVSIMRKASAFRKTTMEHCQEAIKSIRKACPEIEQGEINKHISRVKAKGRVNAINIDKILAKARARIGVN